MKEFLCRMKTKSKDGSSEFWNSCARERNRKIENLFVVLPMSEHCFIFRGRSQWPRGLRHELSSPAPTLRSWVRIPLEAWMFVCGLCAFILCLRSLRWQPASQPT
jgi:hypothetical protein